MEAIVKKVGAGTEYMGQISDCWVKVQLINGLEIQLFVRKSAILKLKKNDKINCLILGFIVLNINSVNFTKGHNIEKPILHGRFISEYSIPEKWWNYDSSFKSQKYPAVQTVNGIFLLYFDNIPENLKDGDIISFTVGRLDLKAWLPIED